MKLPKLPFHFQMFSLRVKAARPDHTIQKLSVHEIAMELLKILEMPRTIRAVPIGLLTTQRRDLWAMNRESLKQGR